MCRGPSSSPGAAATSARSSPTARSPAATRSASSTSTRRPTSRRRVRRRRRARPAPPCARPATASTSCSTTWPRCRWPRTASCSGRSTSPAPPTCSSPPATAGVAKVVHTSSSAIFGIPERNPVTEDTPGPPARGLRPGQARGRAPVPRRGRRRPRRHDRPAPHDPRATAGSASSPCCSSSWPRAPRSTCWAGRQPLPVRPRQRPGRRLPAGRRPREADDLQHRRHRVRHDARDAPGARRPRRHRVARALAAGRAGPRWACRARHVRAGPVRPLPLAALRRVAVVRHDARPGPSSAGSRSTPTPRPSSSRTTGSSPTATTLDGEHRSHHQSPVRLGLLKVLKRLP